MYHYFIDSFLSSDECDDLIVIGESHTLSEMKSSKFINGKLVESNKEYVGNKRLGCYFLDEFLLEPLLNKITKRIIKTSNDLKPFNSIEYNRITKYSFNRYSEGHFLDWHEDKHEIINGATLTYILQLNDNYEGGNIKYSIEGVEYVIPKIKGSVFIFDSNITHCVTNVLSGIRYSINAWPSSFKKVNLL